MTDPCKRSGQTSATLAAAALSLALALPALTALPAAAAPAGGARRPVAATPANPGTEPAGLQAAIDPATGRVRQPTPAELERLDRAFRAMFGQTGAKADGLTAVAAQATVWPDGTVAMPVGAESTNLWVVRINPDGSVTQACVDSVEAANAIAAGTAGTTPVLEEK